MARRKAISERQTIETQIKLELSLDGDGTFKTQGGVPFFNHMLQAMVKYARFNVTLDQAGDLDVDAHHLVEDLGICLGKALKDALGERKGMRRYGWSLVPMDDSLVAASLDLCGRAYLGMDYEPIADRVGDFDVRLAREFLLSFTQHGGFVLHLAFLRGCNDHHMLEAGFKALGWALREAVSVDGSQIVPSTKGKLD